MEKFPNRRGKTSEQTLISSECCTAPCREGPNLHTSSNEETRALKKNGWLRVIGSTRSYHSYSILVFSEKTVIHCQKKAVRGDSIKKEAILRGGPSKMSHKWIAQRSMWTVLINCKALYKTSQDILKEHRGFYVEDKNVLHCWTIQMP